ncbi:MAG: hypothetical protein H6828_05730 [Planctomycetes bacterium]|nr:hypothetical protein [Planctomycetota bacterium]
MSYCRLAVALIPVLLASCLATRMDKDEWQQRTGDLAATAVPAQEALPGARWLEGDLVAGASVRYRVERVGRDGELDTWDLVFTAPTPPGEVQGTLYCRLSGATLDGEPAQRNVASPMFRGAFAARAGDGEYETSEASYALGFTSVGLGRACELVHGADGEAPTTDLQDPEFCASYGTLLAFATLCNDNSEARSLLLSLVQMPSAWRWIVPTLEISAGADLAGAERVTTALGEGWRIPVELGIKGDPALYAQVTTVTPRGALQLTGGVVEVSAIAPDQPERPIRVRLVEACGPAEGDAIVFRVGWTLVD